MCSILYPWNRNVCPRWPVYGVKCLWSRVSWVINGWWHQTGRSTGSDYWAALRWLSKIKTNGHRWWTWTDVITSLIQRAGIREGGLPLRSAFQYYLILFTWRLVTWSWYLNWLHNGKLLTLKFESQGLHIIRIKYWNASGSALEWPPSLPHFRPYET